MQGRSAKMATWIGHLRIAEKLTNELSELDETAFTLGNLGPDSGKPNADWSQFDPPKEVSHFTDAGMGEDKIKDLEFYRRYLVNLSPTDDPARYSYLLGYFFHLLCDNLWSRRVRHTSKNQFAEQYIEQGKEFIWALKQDWYDYLNETTMSRYITDAAEAVLVIHNTLATMPPLDGQHSALFLLHEAHLAPYEAPLGDVG
jgi:hypothetical protein